VLLIALNESVADLAATVKFLVFRPVRRGELIQTLGHVGVVHELLPFNTVLLRRDQALVTLANSNIHEDGLVNYNRGHNDARGGLSQPNQGDGRR
jgi:small conductance mechanosensitive channel